MFSGDFGARLKGSFLSGGGNKKKIGQDNSKDSAPAKTSTSVSVRSARSVPLRDLPTDVLLPIFEKADLSSLVKMRLASSTINNLVEENKKEIFKHRTDKIDLAIPIEEKRFMMFVNKTLLTDPAKQLFGMNVEKLDMYIRDPNVNAAMMKRLVHTVKTFTLNAEPIDVEWEKYPLCGVLYFLRKAEVLIRGIIRENMDIMIQELVNFPHPRLLPHFSMRQEYISSLPIYFRHVWTTENLVRRAKTLPIDVHVMILESDDLLIGFSHTFELPPKDNPSPYDDKLGHLLKVWIVKNERSEILSTVKKAFPDDGKHEDEIAEIVKNTTLYISKPDDWYY